MPDAARKWLEEHALTMRDGEIVGGYITVSWEEADAHLRRLLGQNERLEAMDALLRKTLETQGGQLGNAIFETMKFQADRDALVAYVRVILEVHPHIHPGEINMLKSTMRWQALSDELKELIDVDG